jgi:hypothetical protein
MDRTQELEDQVRRLSQTIDEMHGRMARLEGGAPEHQNGSARSNRRGFLRLGAAAAASALGWMAVKAVPAAAATGGYLVMGSPNVAENPTTLKADAAAVPVLAVEDQNFSQSALTTALGTFTEAFAARSRALAPRPEPSRASTAGRPAPARMRSTASPTRAPASPARA